MPTNLERSLYLVAELVALPTPIVVVMNMMDVAAQEGVHVEPEVLEAALGVPVVPVTATRSSGVQDMIRSIVEETLAGKRCRKPNLPEIRSDHREVLEEILRQIDHLVPPPSAANWVASSYFQEMRKSLISKGAGRYPLSQENDLGDQLISPGSEAPDESPYLASGRNL